MGGYLKQRTLWAIIESSIERIFWSTASICEGEGAEDPERAAFESMMEDAEAIAEEVGTTPDTVRRILREKTGFE